MSCKPKMTFIPNLSILPSPQRQLWTELVNVPSEFTLYGGTAVALQLGHRASIDFDFFADVSIDPLTLYFQIPFLANAPIIQQDKNTFTCRVDRDGEVKVSFFGLPHLRKVMPPLVAPGNQLKVASLIDLAGMKAAAVQSRAESKDYIDLDAIIEAGVDLPHALAAAQHIYGPGFNPQITLKALSYFDDGDVATLPESTKNRLRKAVAATDSGSLPTLASNAGEVRS